MGNKVKVVCVKCGTTNHYPLDALGKKIVCGRCRHPLSEPGSILEPLPGQFSTLYHKSSLPVLVYFYSQTCVHCQGMEPILARLAQESSGRIMVLKANLDTNAGLGVSLGVQGVPTFIVIHRGIEKGRQTGAVPESDLSRWLSHLT